MKKLSELQVYVRQAKKAGICVTGGVNGNGWINLATCCGMLVGGKQAARSYVRKKFGIGSDFHPVQATPEKIAEAQSKVGKRVDSSKRSFVATDTFLTSFEWRRVRMMALKKYGAICQCCGASPANGAVMNVDHIKPRKLFPELALDVNNLQILCQECNHGKGNWDMTDWRQSDGQQREHIKSM